MSISGPGAPRRRWAGRGMAAVALAASLLAGPAVAGQCGDDVGGHDVPCACGDILVSNVILGNDPIVTGPPCAQDGLIVRAPDARRGLVVDLHGSVLRGAGGGVGIRIAAGGPGGARVISSGGPATIVGFADGIVAQGSDTVALIEDVLLTGNGRDGLRVTGPEFAIRRVEVRNAKRDGFALGGRGFQISETRTADCGRFGYLIMGDSGQIGSSAGGNLAERSGTAGFSVMGTGHALANCTAAAGRAVGIRLEATQLDVRGCRATDNGGNGIDGSGNHWRIGGNEALRNAGDGITVRGVDLVDDGGNRGADNQGRHLARGAVQCAISGTPCT